MKHIKKYDGWRHCIEYNSENRGKIQNKNRARQIIDFSGIRYGNITPTDIDGLIEYHDKAMIFLEYKYKNNDVPLGQKIALTRNADNNQKSGKKAVVMICEHNVEDYRQDVKASDAIVREFYYAGEWYKDGKSTVKQKIDSFINFVNKQPF